ncbi:MAG: hypothetical protein K9M98_04890 [Cephaloticoccus sp.]|nr:hypothetical protein [Cephaloticoccus sp.]MCF7759818.1 hypothetical protein [Cephaloticoccus sp.]
MISCLALVTAVCAATAEPGSLRDAFTQGKVSLNLRIRYEGVQQTALMDAEALTLRTRLGYATAPYHGWKTMLEVENIVATDGDSYSQAGINAGGAGHAVVADPETTEFNQALIAYTMDQTTLTVGRQRLVLDNARFVGDVGWRQNMQTFDAVVVQDKSLDKSVLTYAYIDRINRVFSTRHAQGRWNSSSHILNASYSGLPAGTLTGYAYFLDFANATANSCATYGISFSGTTKVSDDCKINYRAEFAQQTDHGSNAQHYRTHYADLEAGLVAKFGNVTFGHEVLGSDRNVGFKTPLATLHAFNGWADLFLGTPTAGLRDTFMKVTGNLPGQFTLLAFAHGYKTDSAAIKLGSELDLQIAHKFGKSTTGLIKYADFRRDSSTLPNVRKLWAQVEFTY